MLPHKLKELPVAISQFLAFHDKNPDTIPAMLLGYSTVSVGVQRILVAVGIEVPVHVQPRNL